MCRPRLCVYLSLASPRGPPVSHNQQTFRMSACPRGAARCSAALTPATRIVIGELRKRVSMGFDILQLRQGCFIILHEQLEMALHSPGFDLTKRRRPRTLAS